MVRRINDIIILTIFPHLFSLYYTFNNHVYSTLIILSTLSSILWHLDHEGRKFLFFDYTCAGLLFLYELKIGLEIIDCVVYLNMLLLITNKTVLILSLNKKINYFKWHSVFHLLSSLKTIYISYLTFKF